MPHPPFQTQRLRSPLRKLVLFVLFMLLLSWAGLDLLMGGVYLGIRMMGPEVLQVKTRNLFSLKDFRFQSLDLKAFNAASVEVGVSGLSLESAQGLKFQTSLFEFRLRPMLSLLSHRLVFDHVHVGPSSLSLPDGAFKLPEPELDEADSLSSGISTFRTFLSRLRVSSLLFERMRVSTEREGLPALEFDLSGQFMERFHEIETSLELHSVSASTTSTPEASPVHTSVHLQFDPRLRSLNDLSSLEAEVSLGGGGGLLFLPWIPDAFVQKELSLLSVQALHFHLGRLDSKSEGRFDYALSARGLHWRESSFKTLSLAGSAVSGKNEPISSLRVLVQRLLVETSGASPSRMEFRNLKFAPLSASETQANTISEAFATAGLERPLDRMLKSLSSMKRHAPRISDVKADPMQGVAPEVLSLSDRNVGVGPEVPEEAASFRLFSRHLFKMDAFRADGFSGLMAEVLPSLQASYREAHPEGYFLSPSEQKLLTGLSPRGRVQGFFGEFGALWEAKTLLDSDGWFYAYTNQASIEGGWPEVPKVSALQGGRLSVLIGFSGMAARGDVSSARVNVPYLHALEKTLSDVHGGILMRWPLHGRPFEMYTQGEAGYSDSGLSVALALMRDRDRVDFELSSGGSRVSLNTLKDLWPDRLLGAFGQKAGSEYISGLSGVSVSATVVQSGQTPSTIKVVSLSEEGEAPSLSLRWCLSGEAYCNLSLQDARFEVNQDASGRRHAILAARQTQATDVDIADGFLDFVPSKGEVSFRLPSVSASNLQNVFYHYQPLLPNLPEGMRLSGLLKGGLSGVWSTGATSFLRGFKSVQYRADLGNLRLRSQGKTLAGLSRLSLFGDETKLQLLKLSGEVSDHVLNFDSTLSDSLLVDQGKAELSLPSAFVFASKEPLCARGKLSEFSLSAEVRVPQGWFEVCGVPWEESSLRYQAEGDIASDLSPLTHVQIDRFNPDASGMLRTKITARSDLLDLSALFSGKAEQTREPSSDWSWVYRWLLSQDVTLSYESAAIAHFSEAASEALPNLQLLGESPYQDGLRAELELSQEAVKASVSSSVLEGSWVQDFSTGTGRLKIAHLEGSGRLWFKKGEEIGIVKSDVLPSLSPPSRALPKAISGEAWVLGVLPSRAELDLEQFSMNGLPTLSARGSLAFDEPLARARGDVDWRLTDRNALSSQSENAKSSKPSKVLKQLSPLAIAELRGAKPAVFHSHLFWSPEDKTRFTMDSTFSDNALLSEAFIGSGEFHLDFNWPGAPWRFDPLLLRGGVKFSLDNGQIFSEHLSSNATARFLTLFSFNEFLHSISYATDKSKFPFSSIEGSLKMSHGYAVTQEPIRVDSPLMKLQSEGYSDLLSGYFSQEVSVLPGISGGLNFLGLVLAPITGGTSFIASISLDRLSRLLSAKSGIRYRAYGYVSHPQKSVVSRLEEFDFQKSPEVQLSLDPTPEVPPPSSMPGTP